MHFHCDKGLFLGSKKIVVAIDANIALGQVDLSVKKNLAINCTAIGENLTVSGKCHAIGDD